MAVSIGEVIMKVICQHCGNKFDYHMYVGLCPKCGKIYRTRSETVEHNTGIVLNATYSTEDIHPEQEEYWNHSHTPQGGYVPGHVTRTETVYPEKMYQQTQLNKAYRPPQSVIRTTARAPQKQSNASVVAVVVIFIIITMLMIMGYALSSF